MQIHANPFVMALHRMIFLNDGLLQEWIG
jgi:hypothetical protein